MTDTEQLLEFIEAGIVAHGGDLGGWTRLDDGALQIFDGQATLRAEIEPSASAADEKVHAHVIATLLEHEDEPLEACVIGRGDTREDGLRQAAQVWCGCVAGVLRSYLAGRPMCASSTANDLGLPDRTAFTGSTMARGMTDERALSALDGQPWFAHAANFAEPRRLHLAKVTLLSQPDKGFSRNLEVDRDDYHFEPDWQPGLRATEAGYVIRFAVFETTPEEVAARTELDRAIRHFAGEYGKHESVDALTESMQAAGFALELIDEVESFATMAFGRHLFDGSGVQYPSTFIRAGSDGQVETDVPLAAQPAYCRGWILAGEIAASMSEEDYQTLACYHAESNTILQALDAANGSTDALQGMTLGPSLVPERGVSDATMQRGYEALQAWFERAKRADPPTRKPWWKFW